MRSFSVSIEDHEWGLVEKYCVEATSAENALSVALDITECEGMHSRKVPYSIPQGDPGDENDADDGETYRQLESTVLALADDDDEVAHTIIIDRIGGCPDTFPASW